MSWLFFQPKKPTPSEYAVLVVFSSLVFLGFGIVALVLASRAPGSKHEAAVSLAQYGFWCLGFGAFIAVAYWLYRRWNN